MAREFTLMSWNVNGIRAAVNKGFVGFLKGKKPDVLGLQEIKITNEARQKVEFDFADYAEYWNPAERPGYSGTAVLTKVAPLTVSDGFVVPASSTVADGPGSKSKMLAEEREGRVQTLEFEKFYFLNCYFPNANHELSRLDFKEDFNRVFLKYVTRLEQNKPVVICGDFNVAHEEIDLARPKENVGNPGFTDEERHWADEFVQHGLVDTFRHLHPNKKEYSWWSYRALARERNIGWRIDYFFVSEKFMRYVKDAFILGQIEGSDHCPVGITIECSM